MAKKKAIYDPDISQAEFERLRNLKPGRRKKVVAPKPRSNRHAELPLRFNPASYFKDGNPRPSFDQINATGRDLGFAPLSNRAFEWVGHGFRFFVYGHAGFINSPLRSRVKERIESLYSVANDPKKLVKDKVKSLTEILNETFVDHNLAANVFHQLDNVHGLGMAPKNLVDNLSKPEVISRLAMASERYLREYQPIDGAPNEFYFNDFLICLGTAYLEWTGEHPRDGVGYDQYGRIGTGKFFEFVRHCFNLFRDNYVQSDEALSKRIRELFQPDDILITYWKF